MRFHYFCNLWRAVGLEHGAYGAEASAVYVQQTEWTVPCGPEQGLQKQTKAVVQNKVCHRDCVCVHSVSHCLIELCG